MTALKALDVFHLKCLRKVLKMKTTYIDRTNTNETVIKKANEALPPNKQIKLLSSIYLDRKHAFFTKIVLAESNEPTRRITFVDELAQRRTHVPRRVGRPKAKWANMGCKRIWEKNPQKKPETK